MLLIRPIFNSISESIKTPVGKFPQNLHTMKLICIYNIRLDEKATLEILQKIFYEKKGKHEGISHTNI